MKDIKKKKRIIVVKGKSTSVIKDSGKVEPKRIVLPLELSPRGVFAVDGIVFIVGLDHPLVVGRRVRGGGTHGVVLKIVVKATGSSCVVMGVMRVMP